MQYTYNVSVKGVRATNVTFRNFLQPQIFSSIARIWG